ncbi:Suppressor of mec-8 and unc-52 protein homolog 2 [Linum perenne]
MTQEEKDRGLGSVFKRDDQRLQQLREKDAREKDPNFVSESYSECYPGYQEYNREVVDSDDEDDLSKMDMGGQVSNNLFIDLPCNFTKWSCVKIDHSSWCSVLLLCELNLGQYMYLNRQKAVFIGGILRQRKTGQSTMSRRKQCPRQHSSLV